MQHNTMEEPPTDLKAEIKIIMDEIIDEVNDVSEIPVTTNCHEKSNNLYANAPGNKDLMELYKYVNAMQLDIHRHTNAFIEVWDLLQGLITRMINLDELPNSISKLTNNIISLEETNKKIGNSMTNLAVKSNDNKSRIKKIKDFSEQIEAMEENFYKEK